MSGSIVYRGGNLVGGGVVYLSAVPFARVEERLRERCYLFIPVASLEPFGAHAAVGCSTAVCRAIAEGVCGRTDGIMAPSLHYGYATPFRSFPGAIGLKAKHLGTAVGDILTDCAVQGFAGVVLIDGSYDCLGVLETARARVLHAHPTMTVEVFAWQHQASVRRMVAERIGRSSQGRLDWGVLSMACHVDPSLVDTDHWVEGTSPAYSSQWMKRGRDPDKLRKLMPEGLACSEVPDASFGRSLFSHITDLLTRRVLEAQDGRSGR